MLPEFYRLDYSKRTVDYTIPTGSLQAQSRDIKKYSKKEWKRLSDLINQITLDQMDSVKSAQVDQAWISIHLKRESDEGTNYWVSESTTPESLIKVLQVLRKEKKE